MAKPRADPEMARAWIRAVLTPRAVCIVCGGRRALQGHHVISQQALRKIALDLRCGMQGLQDLLWDPRNGVVVCERCHERHTLAVRRIRRATLPAAFFAFVTEIDARFTDGRQPALVRLEEAYP